MPLDDKAPSFIVGPSRLRPAVREVECKSVLTKSGLPESEYSINPYTGCQVGCIYCYAVFMRRWTGHKEPWGFFIDVKKNAPAILRRELPAAKRGTTLLSSVTDPYQAVERKYRLTRQILEILLEWDWPTSILTKCALVTRDLDLLAKFTRPFVGMTISGTREDARRVFEPLSSPYQARLTALRLFHDAGVKTYVFIGPILPFLTDPVEVFEQLDGSVDEIMMEALNWKGQLQPSIREGYRRFFPEQYHLLESAIAEKGVGYVEWVKERTEVIRRRTKVPVKLFIH